MRHAFWKPALVAMAIVFSACGGGDDASTSAVRVVGDSLSDGGTFGAKATIQGTSLDETLLWVDVVAADVGRAPLCPRYSAASGAPALNPSATQCTNYAIGGGVVNVPGTGAADASPFSVVQQLKDMAAAGSFGSEDLLLVDGGGNDAAAVFSAFLAASRDGGASYVSLMSELLTPQQVQTAIAGGQTGLVGAGNQYMEALAGVLADAVVTNALDKGARRVVILTVPNVARTPRFADVLTAVAAQSGGGAQGEAVAAQLRVVADGWVRSFNTRLLQRFAGTGRVAVVDFYATLNGWIDNPTSGGFSNVTRPACPAVGVDGLGLPTYSLGTCNAADLSANPPSGAAADWWQTYLFSDNFHGTPRTNRLVAERVLQTMSQKGWR